MRMDIHLYVRWHYPSTHLLVPAHLHMSISLKISIKKLPKIRQKTELISWKSRQWGVARSLPKVYCPKKVYCRRINQNSCILFATGEIWVDVRFQWVAICVTQIDLCSSNACFCVIHVVALEDFMAAGSVWAKGIMLTFSWDKYHETFPPNHWQWMYYSTIRVLYLSFNGRGIAANDL